MSRSSSSVTNGQFSSIRAINRERLGRGEKGLYDDLQEIIDRYVDGGIAGTEIDQRILAAKFLFDRRFGEFLRKPARTFEKYLAGVPTDIPENPDPLKYQYLVLVDRRLGLRKSCELLGIVYGGDDRTYEDYDRERRQDDVYWFWGNNGSQNRNRVSIICRDGFEKPEIGQTAGESIMLVSQHPDALERDRSMDLVGSVRAQYRDYVVNLCRFVGGSLKLRYGTHGGASPKFGAATRAD